MATTISNGVQSTSPDLITSWATEQEARTNIHQILNSTNPSVTLRPAMKRTGTLNLFYKTQTDASNARTILSTASAWTITSTTDTIVNGFHFVVTGSIGAELEDVTREMWTITVGFQEVNV